MNVKIMGADQSVTNLSGTDWLPAVQATTKRSRLYKVTFSPLAGMAADLYAWIFDADAGTAATLGPVAVRYIPAGVADTWDFSADGSLFQRGIYLSLSTVPPTIGSTAMTVAANNKLIIKADVRAG